jgi:hypothetical protein
MDEEELKLEAVRQVLKALGIKSATENTIPIYRQTEEISSNREKIEENIFSRSLEDFDQKKI